MRNAVADGVYVFNDIPDGCRFRGKEFKLRMFVGRVDWGGFSKERFYPAEELFAARGVEGMKSGRTPMSASGTSSALSGNVVCL